MMEQGVGHYGYKKVLELTGSEYIAYLAVFKLYKPFIIPKKSKCGCATCISRIAQENQIYSNLKE